MLIYIIVLFLCLLIRIQRALPAARLSAVNVWARVCVCVRRTCARVSFLLSLQNRPTCTPVEYCAGNIIIPGFCTLLCGYVEFKTITRYLTEN